MADKGGNKSENKGGGKSNETKTSTHSIKTELRDSGRVGNRKPLSEQKITSNLKPPTRPKK